MPPTILRDYHVNLLDTMRGMSNSDKWWTAPLNLGGSSGADGGSGVPLGGVYGQLPQGKIAYDTTEDSYSGYYDPALPSILDNLAHMRYSIALISGGISSIREDGVEIVSDATVLNFDAEFEITDAGGGEALIGYGTLLRQRDDRYNYHEDGAITFWRHGSQPNTTGIEVGYYTNFINGSHGFKVRIVGDDFGKRGFLEVGGIEASTYYRDRFVDIDGDLSPATSSITRLYGIVSSPGLIPRDDGTAALMAVYGRADVGKTSKDVASGIAFFAQTPGQYAPGYGFFDLTYGLYVEDQNVGNVSGYAIYTNLGHVSLGDTLDMRGNRIINISDTSLKFQSGITITSADYNDLTDGGETTLHSHAGGGGGSGVGPHTLGSDTHTDVTFSGVVTDDVIAYDISEWKNRPGLFATLSGLANDDVLAYDLGDDDWKNTPAFLITISGLQDDDIIRYDDETGFWRNEPSGETIQAYGHAYQNSSFVVTISDNNPTEVDDASTPTISGGLLKNIAFTDHYLRVLVSGIYKIDWSLAMSMDNAAGTPEVHGGIMINNMAQIEGRTQRTIQTANDVGAMSSICVLDLGINAQISLFVRNETNNNDVTIEHYNVTVVFIGE
ncbi:hypothetical protein LCGC14_0482990 [marine sediment metagenome]|uniref:Uncharacterized protein n=1 Tax=marine sediment metagenome TaxID=412755 RepID=A0A0F9UVY4_9ZZZZ